MVKASLGQGHGKVKARSKSQQGQGKISVHGKVMERFVGKVKARSRIGLAKVQRQGQGKIM